MSVNIYERELDKNHANHAPLTPLTFLAWTADVYPERLSVVHGARRFTWGETRKRSAQLAAALAARGVGRGDTVSAMLSNTPEMIEAHFGVPMTGAVLHALNTRLDADALAFMLQHAETKVLLVDREFSTTIAAALAKLERELLVIDVLDDEYHGPGTALGTLDYEALLREPDAAQVAASLQHVPRDEWDAIALNYTSGTTGNPKGVVYHHRGAYLNALNNVIAWGMPKHAVYLWTLPMFHCNGWCFPWTLAAIAGTHVCLRKVEASAVFELMRTHGVTHYCGAPIVHSTLVHAAKEQPHGVTQAVKALVGGAAPQLSMIEGMASMGFDLTHVYGLTEVYGPASVCAKHDAWQDLDMSQQAERNGRQGVRSLLQEGMTVMDPDTMQPVAADGETMGEIMFRGNITMKGYLKNPTASSESFAGGWFHSGDLAVLQPDGYIKIKDRAKDIIISGGENISSLEVEDALYRHPAVLAAAVVAEPHPKWGESPCAFVELKPNASATESEIIAHCRERLAHFKAPRRVIFGELPKTSTGKIQKFLLRARTKSSTAIE
jgi:fatty-acyl-CoA synthase